MYRVGAELVPCREEWKQIVEAEAAAREETETQLKSILETETQLKSVLEEKGKQNTAMLARINKMEEDRNELHTRAQAAEEVCGGFQEEAEKSMEDYRKLAAQLQALTDENGKIRQERSKFFSELSKRTDDVVKKGKELKSKDVELKSKEEELKKKDVELAKVKEQCEEKLKAQEGATEAQVSVSVSLSDEFITHAL